MSETNPPSTRQVQNAWGADLETAVCEHCQARYLVPCDTPPPQCPNCYQGRLAVMPNGLPEMPHPYPPELVAPFDLSEQKLAEAMRRFSASIPFTPGELTPANLRSHLAKLYLPMWLVDGMVSANWQADAGFDYQVISHQESFEQNLGSWKSREIKEPRVRWETRLGRLSRAYQNVAAPALEDAASLEKRLGRFALDRALSYTPEYAGQALMRMPDRPPQAAWGEAAAAFQKIAAEECMHACGANHLRQFRWKARFDRLNWTLMLLPIYSTCYQDDTGRTQTVLIHGQSGAVSGIRRASLRRAGRAGLIILAIGVLIFLAGVLLDAASTADATLRAFSMYMGVLGIAGILAAGIPIVIAWDFNRRQKLEEAEFREFRAEFREFRAESREFRAESRK